MRRGAEGLTNPSLSWFGGGFLFSLLEGLGGGLTTPNLPSFGKIVCVFCVVFFFCFIFGVLVLQDNSISLHFQRFVSVICCGFHVSFHCNTSWEIL